MNYAELRIPVREGTALQYANPAKLTALLVSGNDRSLLTGYVNGDPGGQLVVSSPSAIACTPWKSRSLSSSG